MVPRGAPVVTDVMANGLAIGVARFGAVLVATLAIAVGVGVGHHGRDRRGDQSDQNLRVHLFILLWPTGIAGDGLCFPASTTGIPQGC